jgi:HSP20 family molecular chaperone IbpA
MTINKEICKIKEEPIRHHFDEKSEEFYFSIVDVLSHLQLSKDPRNYWKVAKNRLKNSDNELVTECNQLKMRSNDGKYYLTDVATSSTILKILQSISPSQVTTAEEFLSQIEKKQALNNINYFSDTDREEKISTVLFDGNEIKLDMYQKDNYIFITMMAPGIEEENIFVSLNCKTISIKINNAKENNLYAEYYNIKELFFGKSSRIISLPYEVDIDRVEATNNQGLIIIKLFILDKTRVKIIKIKSL